MGLFGGRKKTKGRGRGTSRREPTLFEDDRPHNARQAGKVKPKRRGFFRWLFSLFWALLFWSGIAAAAGFGLVWFTLSQNGLFKIPEREPGILLLASDGSEIAEQGTFFGDAVNMAELPDYVSKAIISIEDRRFYSHYGVDPIGLARAMGRNVMQRRMREGGSTLTQQLAKNLFLSPERTITRKAQEMVFAIWLETKFSKDEILQLYLNRVYFGGRANGIDKAARTFYGKSAYELSLMEAATLAGLLKAPTTYNPSRNPEDAKTRAKLVLNSMVREGYIDESDAREALESDSKAADPNYTPATQYAVDWISSQLPLLVKDNRDSLIIETTLDPKLQASAERSLRKRLADNGKKLSVGQGAVVSMDGTGAIKALVGGRSYKRSQYNRATSAKRQPGSAFKAFVYLAALENGYRSDSVEVDEPVKIGNWSPENYKRKYLGTVTLAQSYALSLNTIAAKLTQAVTPKSVARVAKRLGISSALGTDATIALGTSEVTLLEMTTAFAPFANGGASVEPYIVKRILNRDGQVLYQRLGSGLGQVVGDSELRQMNAMMRQVMVSGTGQKARFDGMDMGGKTGTSQDYRDAWFIGYTPYLITGVWMGNDDNSPTRKVTGGSLPALVWNDVMKPGHKALAERLLPGGDDIAPTQVALAEADAVREPDPVVEQNLDPVEKPADKPRRKKPGFFERLFGLGGDADKRKKSDELY
jgi:penicillin-binding protein 1A